MFSIVHDIVELTNNKGETIQLRKGKKYSLTDEYEVTFDDVSFFEFDDGQLIFCNGDFSISISYQMLRKIKNNSTGQELISFVEEKNENNSI